MGGNKRLAINMVANLLAFTVQFGVSFLLTPYIIRTLGSEAYGFVPLATNLAGMASIVTIALGSMASRFITIEDKRCNHRQAGIYFNSVLVADTILALLLLIPGVGIVLYANHLLDIPSRLLLDVQATLAFAFLAMAVNTIFTVFQCCFFMRNRIDLNARRNIEANLLRAVILVGLFMLMPPHVSYVTGTMLVVSLYTGFAGVWFTRRLTPEYHVDVRQFRWSAVKTLLSSGVWNSVNQLSSMLMSQLDLLLMNLFVGASASGIFAVVKTVPNFVQQVVGVLVSVFMPEFTILYAQKRQRELLDRINFSIKGMGLFITVPIGYLIVFGGDFFRTWVPDQDASLLQGLSILTIVPMIITGSINTIFNVYTVTNKLRLPALVLFATGLLNVVVAAILLMTTDWGIWVIPIVSFVINVARNLIFTPIYAARCLELHWSVFYKAIIRGGLCSVTMMLVCAAYRWLWSMTPLSSGNGGVAVGWGQLILAGCVCSVIALAMNAFVVLNSEERARMRNKIIGKFMHSKGSGQ